MGGKLWYSLLNTVRMQNQLIVAGSPSLRVEAPGDPGLVMTTIENAAAAAAAVGEGLIGINTVVTTDNAITGAVEVEASVAAQVGVAALSGNTAEATARMLMTDRSQGLMKERSLHMGKGLVVHLGIEALLWLILHLLPMLPMPHQYGRVLAEEGVHLLMVEMPAGVAANPRSLTLAAALTIQMLRSVVQTEWQFLISYTRPEAAVCFAVLHPYNGLALLVDCNIKQCLPEGCMFCGWLVCYLKHVFLWLCMLLDL